MPPSEIINFDLMRLPNQTFRFDERPNVILPPERFRGHEPVGSQGHGFDIPAGATSRLCEVDPAIDLRAAGIVATPSHVRVTIANERTLRIERDRADVSEPARAAA